MDIIVIGIGHIGLVAACCLANSGHRVTGVEIDQAKLNFLNHPGNLIYEKGIQEMLREGLDSGRLTFVPNFPVSFKADVAMITVNTPTSSDGKADLSNLYAVVSQVREAARSPLIMVVKSTVSPGTGAMIMKRYLDDTSLAYVANPEFLRTGQAVNDWYHPSRIVIGSDNQDAIEGMRHLYSDIEAPLLVTDVTSAEMIKCAANSFLATKVSFINEIANLCDALGANIDDVVKGLGLDPRIGTSHLQPGIGYGGPCLPKDLQAMASLSDEKGYDFKLLKAVIEVNTRQRVIVVDRLKQFLGSLKGKKITLLGLAFKPDTNEAAEAPSLDIARQLIAEGVKLHAYDPVAMESAKIMLPADVVLASDIYAAAAGACAVILATEWPEFNKADWQRIKRSMTQPYVVFDGRNALPKDRLVAEGFKYVGVGRTVDRKVGKA
ncbi:MAG: UDP-glucose/GDP-mannose dehydrogenase family protein [Dehalococcoidales bacterium]